MPYTKPRIDESAWNDVPPLLHDGDKIEWFDVTEEFKEKWKKSHSKKPIFCANKKCTHGVLRAGTQAMKYQFVIKDMVTKRTRHGCVYLCSVRCQREFVIARRLEQNGKRSRSDEKALPTRNDIPVSHDAGEMVREAFGMWPNGRRA